MQGLSDFLFKWWWSKWSRVEWGAVRDKPRDTMI